jgi:tetratricopeptide (TPR) repeat protein
LLSANVGREVDRLVAAIRAGRVTVFCGAGISKHSGLPLVSELLPALLHALEASMREVELLSQAKLPFEAFVEILQLNSRIEPLLDLFALGEPSATHRLLAKLARAGRLLTIATTNFDDLLERALADEALSTASDFGVLYDETSWRPRTPETPLRVLKLHGTIADRASLAATVRSVAARDRTGWRAAGIREIFGASRPAANAPDDGSAEECVLILGYSCSDVFDLVPLIEAVPEPRKLVVLVQHSTAMAVRELGDFGERSAFREYAGRWLQCDTDELMAELWERLLGGEAPSTRAEPCWLECVARWKSGVERHTQHHILGALLAKISENASALEHYARASELPGGATPIRTAMVSLRMSESLRAMGRGEEAMARAREALAIARAAEHSRLELIALVELGAAQHVLGDHRGALESYREGMALLERHPDEHETAQMLGRMAAAHRHLGEQGVAIDGYRRAREAASHAGDKWSELANLINQSVCERELRNFGTATEILERARALARDLGDRQAELLCLGNLGNCLHDCGNPRRALECYEQVQSLAQEMGDGLSLRTAFADIGQAQADLGDHEAALRSLNTALSMARAAGDRDGEAIALSYLAALRERAALGTGPRTRDENPEVKAVQPRAVSGAAADRAAEQNIAYQRALQQWQALPLWKRIITSKPEAPRGI